MCARVGLANIAASETAADHIPVQETVGDSILLDHKPCKVDCT